MGMSGVFISYSRDDNALARRVQLALNALGVEVIWDETMPSTYWQKYLRQKINELAAVLVIWTPNSIESDSVDDEARLATETGKLVNVKIGIPKPPWPHDKINALPIEDWNGVDRHNGWERLIVTIDEKLAKAGAAQPGAIIAALKNQQAEIKKRRAAITQAASGKDKAQAGCQTSAVAYEAAQANLQGAEQQVGLLKTINASKTVMVAARNEREEARKAVADAKTRLADADAQSDLSVAAFTNVKDEFETWSIGIGAATVSVTTSALNLEKASPHANDEELTNPELPAKPENPEEHLSAEQQKARKADERLAAEEAAAKLQADEENEAVRRKEAQRNAEALAAAEAARLAKEAADKAQRERDSLAALAKAEERRRADYELARSQRERMERRQIFWSSVRKAARQYWWAAAGAAGLVAITPLLMSFPTDVVPKAVNPANTVSTAAVAYKSEKAVSPREAPKWLLGNWGLNGDCDTPIIISKAENGIGIAFGVDSKIAVESIVSDVTESAVKTDQALYSLKNETETVTISPKGMNLMKIKKCGAMK